MNECLCPMCTPIPAPTFTPEYRAECEARMVAALPDQEARTAYLAGVAKWRGVPASAELRAAAKAVFAGIRWRE